MGDPDQYLKLDPTTNQWQPTEPPKGGASRRKVALIAGACSLLALFIGVGIGASSEQTDLASTETSTSTSTQPTSTIPSTTAAPTTAAPTTPPPTAAPTTKAPADRKLEAFNICKDFVKDRLKAPSTAKFRNFFEDDGEVEVTGSGDGPYVVLSTVDSQNSFGGQLRSTFTCKVLATGDRWTLQDIAIA